jgi:hypothetical protein
MSVRPYDEKERQERLQKLEGKSVRFFVPWSPDERAGVLRNVGFSTCWVGAFVYSHHHLLNLREQST